MPRPDDEKNTVLAMIETHVGPTRSAHGRHWWRLTRDFSISVFITYSGSDPPWYDLSPRDLGQWLAYRQAFVAFVIGDHTEVLIVPALDVQELIQELKRNGYDPAGYGDYKLHLVHRGGMYRFREAPSFDTAGFLNGYGRLGGANRA